MLTAELVRVRRRGETITPAWLHGPQLVRALPVAQALLEIFEQAPGHTMGEIDERLKDIPDSGLDRARLGGFIKLLKDACELDEVPAADAEHVRNAVFIRAAESRRLLGILEPFDRSAVLAAAAVQLETTPDAVESGLFADLPSAQIVRSFRRMPAQALVQRYNLALAQGVLLRATRVQIELAPCPAPRLRELLRKIKFCRLMVKIQGEPASGYRLVVDGPLSLFEATQRYGVQLASFLPTLVAGEGWKLRADVRWGPQRTPATFELSDSHGLVSHSRDPAVDLDETVALARSFARTAGPWAVRHEATVFDLRGGGVFVPDLVFENSLTGAKVYLEVFGYWSRDAVFQRLEALETGFAHQVILAVSRKLRVSDEAPSQDFPGRILVYASSIPAGAVARLLKELQDGE